MPVTSTEIEFERVQTAIGEVELYAHSRPKQDYTATLIERALNGDISLAWLNTGQKINAIADLAWACRHMSASQYLRFMKAFEERYSSDENRARILIEAYINIHRPDLIQSHFTNGSQSITIRFGQLALVLYQRSNAELQLVDEPAWRALKTCRELVVNRKVLITIDAALARKP